MTTILLLVAVLSILAFGLMIHQLRQAPEGHEDAAGFHFADRSAARRQARVAVKVEDSSGAAHPATQHLPAT